MVAVFRRWRLPLLERDASKGLYFAAQFYTFGSRLQAG
jgi:hypothetical protein